MKDKKEKDNMPQNEDVVIDFTNAEEVRKAFIASEILRRKY